MRERRLHRRGPDPARQHALRQWPRRAPARAGRDPRQGGRARHPHGRRASRPTRSGSTSSRRPSRWPPADGQSVALSRVALRGLRRACAGLRGLRLCSGAFDGCGVAPGVGAAGSDAHGERDDGRRPGAGRWAARSPPCRHRRGARPPPGRAPARVRPVAEPRRRTPGPTTSGAVQRRPARRHLEHDGRPLVGAGAGSRDLSQHGAARRRRIVDDPAFHLEAPRPRARPRPRADIPRRSGTRSSDGPAATNARDAPARPTTAAAPTCIRRERRAGARQIGVRTPRRDAEVGGGGRIGRVCSAPEVAMDPRLAATSDDVGRSAGSLAIIGATRRRTAPGTSAPSVWRVVVQVRQRGRHRRTPDGTAGAPSGTRRPPCPSA